MHKKTRNESRLLEKESGMRQSSTAGALHFVLAYPNSYRTAMASLGYQTVYATLTRHPKSVCERVCLPDDKSIQEMQRTQSELRTLESEKSMRESDVLAFSVAFEPDYVNVVRMLELSNIPLYAKNRDHTHPFIIGGGPAMTFNPEPVADFFDAVVIGDAEEVLLKVVDVMHGAVASGKEDVLLQLAEIDGVYVPAFYTPEYDGDGRFVRMETKDGVPSKVRRAVARDISKYPGESVIFTPEGEFGDIYLVEIARGCPYRCRFCVAGHIGRPYRERDIESVYADRPAHLKDKRMGLVSAAVFDHSMIAPFCEKASADGVDFTVSSIRLETFDRQAAQMLVKSGQKTVTFAPEAATVRLRKVINKDISDEDIDAAVNTAVEAGFGRVKLYFMIGLPTEEDADIEGIVGLLKRLADKYEKAEFSVSASVFVPKPCTPFQWCAFADEKILAKRAKLLKDGLGKVARVKCSVESVRMAKLQAVFARGDRRAALIAVEAAKTGVARAMKEHISKCTMYLAGSEDVNAPLAWEHIDCLLDKRYLALEYERALAGRLTPPCNLGKCYECGVCAVLGDRV